MKLVRNQSVALRSQVSKAFTLIEMIGVLAVIAILAALLIPKVFTAISNARVNNAAVSCETVKAALADHYAKFGSIPMDGSVTPATPLAYDSDGCKQFDVVLLKEGFLDKPFSVKIGDGTSGPNNTHVEVIDISSLTAGTDVTGGQTTGYALGSGKTNSVTGSALVQAVITGVTEADAQDLSTKIDGPVGSDDAAMSSAIKSPDYNGRVKYEVPANGKSTTTVYVYLSHR